MEKFNASIAFDQRLWSADLTGSEHYARHLGQCGLLTAVEVTALLDGLSQIRNEWTSDKFVIQAGDEDVHTAHERRLGELIGTAIAGKLHTGRSRNDQVAVDMRLWMRDVCTELEGHITGLLATIVNHARANLDVLLPGYTHLQVFLIIFCGDDGSGLSRFAGRTLSWRTDGLCIRILNDYVRSFRGFTARAV
jgi:argininosuccinate lyase